MFPTLIGHAPVKMFLERAVRENCLAQTLLFRGPEGVGKSLFAKELAKILLRGEKTLDLRIFTPEGKGGGHSIDSLREMIEQSHEASFGSCGKVLIIEEAHRMQPAAANALLKTLEEPSFDTTFILISSRPFEILPTILSRCTSVRFSLLTEEEIGSILKEKGHPPHFAKWAQGSASQALFLAERKEFELLRQMLFSLLEKPFWYPEFSLEVGKLEGILEEGKEEDPLFFHKKIEYAFDLFWMWHRDQHVRKMGGKPELLFFPDLPPKEPKELSSLLKEIEKGRLCIERNIKISSVFLSLLTP